MTYEYLCAACGHEWEAQQRISEDALKDCPQCGQSAAKRQVSGGQGFLLKGGGWYSDLYGLKPKGSKDPPGPAAGDGQSSSSSKPAKSEAPKPSPTEPGGKGSTGGTPKASGKGQAAA